MVLRVTMEENVTHCSDTDQENHNVTEKRPQRAYHAWQVVVELKVTVSDQEQCVCVFIATHPAYNKTQTPTL